MKPVASRLDVDRISADRIDSDGEPATAFELLQRGAERWPARVALRYLPDPVQFERCRDLTYAALFDRVCAAAGLFAAHGARRDDVIAVALPNLPEAHFAIWGAGATARVMAVNPDLPGETLADRLAAAGARMLVADAMAWWHHADAIVAANPRLEHVFLVGEADALGRPELQVHDFIVALNQRVGARIAPPPTRHDGVLSSTAGTTGPPRLVRRTLAAELLAARALRPMLGDLLGENAVVAGGLPLFHSTVATASGLLPWMAGAMVVTAGPAGFRNPDYVQRFWRIVAHYGVSIAALHPAVIAQLLRVPIGDSDIATLRYAISGTARLPAALHRRFERATGVRLLSCYGLVEGGCIATMTPPAGERRAGSAGITIPWHRTRVVRRDAGGAFAGDCDIDEPGRLLVSGPALCEGYADGGDGGRNAVAWFDCRDGLRWLDTGDIARIDADGYHWIAGRDSEVIRRDGRVIAPDRIEDPLLRHPMVAAAAVIARPDIEAGEVPVAYVVLRDGGQSDAPALAAFLAQETDDDALQPAAIHIVERLPLTPLGKVDKVALRREQMGAAVDAVSAAADAAAERDD